MARLTTDGEVEREEGSGVRRGPLPGEGDEDEGSDLGTLDQRPNLAHLVAEADMALHLDDSAVLALDFGRLCERGNDLC